MNGDDTIYWEEGFQWDHANASYYFVGYRAGKSNVEPQQKAPTHCSRQVLKSACHVDGERVCEHLTPDQIGLDGRPLPNAEPRGGSIPRTTHLPDVRQNPNAPYHDQQDQGSLGPSPQSPAYTYQGGSFFFEFNFS